MLSTHQGLCFGLICELVDLTLEIQYVVMIVYSSDEPGIVVGPNTLPFLHFSISALTLTYHDTRNRRGTSCELHKPT